MGISYDDALKAVQHRPYPLPGGIWRMRQRWNDLLFAHWPIPAAEMQALLPAGLEVDTYDGWAWVGVVPFWMDEVQSRVVGSLALGVPGATKFAELNVRTYVRSRKTGKAGVYFFSLDCESLLAVTGARTIFHLPYFFAAMATTEVRGVIGYASRRILAGGTARFEAAYRATGEVRLGEPGSIEEFLTERYCLFTTFLGRVLVGEIHHEQWPLQPAEMEIRVNEVAAVAGIRLPERAPVLHFAREIRVSIWGLMEE